MNYKDILRNKPWLRYVNKGNISTRLLKATNGNAFIVYNLIQCSYQLHTIEAEKISGDSMNCCIDEEAINQWIIDAYNMNDFNKYVDDIMSENQKRELFHSENFEHKKRELELNSQLRSVERVLGTRI